MKPSYCLKSLHVNISNYNIFLLSDIAWIATNCFLLSIFHSFCITLIKYGFKGSQQFHVSRAVWGCFKHNWENGIDWTVLMQS